MEEALLRRVQNLAVRNTARRLPCRDAWRSRAPGSALLAHRGRICRLRLSQRSLEDGRGCDCRFSVVLRRPLEGGGIFRFLHDVDLHSGGNGVLSFLIAFCQAKGSGELLIYFFRNKRSQAQNEVDRGGGVEYFTYLLGNNGIKNFAVGDEPALRPTYFASLESCGI